MFSIAFGKADSLLVVANAIVNGSRMALKNCLIGTRAIIITAPSTTNTKMKSARYNEPISLPRFTSTVRPLVAIVWAIAAPTPIGANIIT